MSGANKKIVLQIVALIIVLILGAIYFFKKPEPKTGSAGKERLQTPQPAISPSTTSPLFNGPVGTPHVIGPKANPPNY